jgi:hypothetical protein
VTQLAGLANRRLDQTILQNKPVDDRNWWLRQWREVRARAEVLGQPDGVRRAFGSDPGLAHWAAATLGFPAGRSAGWGPPHWDVRDGS